MCGSVWCLCSQERERKREREREGRTLLQHYDESIITLVDIIAFWIRWGHWVHIFDVSVPLLEWANESFFPYLSLPFSPFPSSLCPSLILEKECVSVSPMILKESHVHWGSNSKRRLKTAHRERAMGRHPHLQKHIKGKSNRALHYKTWRSLPLSKGSACIFLPIVYQTKRDSALTQLVKHAVPFCLTGRVIRVDNQEPWSWWLVMGEGVPMWLYVCVHLSMCVCFYVFLLFVDCFVCSSPDCPLNSGWGDCVVYR